VFYFVCSVTDWATYFISRYEINSGGSFICLDEKFFVADSNFGAFIMLVFSVVILAYSCVMIYIFYVIPAKIGHAFGADLNTQGSQLDVTQRDTFVKLGETMLEQEEQAKHLFSVLQKDEEFTRSNITANNRSPSGTSDEP
jgi:hypothetical protein